MANKIDNKKVPVKKVPVDVNKLRVLCSQIENGQVGLSLQIGRSSTYISHFVNGHTKCMPYAEYELIKALYKVDLKLEEAMPEKKAEPQTFDIDFTEVNNYLKALTDVVEDSAKQIVSAVNTMGNLLAQLQAEVHEIKKTTSK